MDVGSAGAIASLNFFQNQFDSTVEGIDVVGSYTRNWESGQRSSAVVSFNTNAYSIDRVTNPNLFNAASIYNFENNAPDWRSTVTLSHDIGKFSGMVRANLFGPYSRSTTAAPILYQNYKTEALWDLELDYKMTDKVTFTVGGRNVTDAYPPVNVINASNGAIYSDGPVDWQGGYYYGRVNYTF